MLNKKSAFTIIELIMVIVIISIIALTTSAILLFFMRNTIFLPNQMNVQQVADAAMDIMIEGLRFSSRVTEAGDNNIRFVNAGGDDIRFRINNNVITRTIDVAGGGAEEPIPYYATGNITISGEDNKLFRFYDETDTPMATPTLENINRVEIKLVAKSGTGEFNDWEGKLALGSSVKICRVNQYPVFTAGPIADPDEILQTEKSSITFSVNDLDGGEVSWGTEVTGDTKGKLTEITATGGSATVPYNVEIEYSPWKKFEGTATVTITLDDGDGGIVTSDPVNILVTK